MLHDINWHVPHHVCVAIPHYRLRQAHLALRKQYPGGNNEYVFNWALIRGVTSKCHFIVSRNPHRPDTRWLSYREARALERVAEQQPRSIVNEFA